VLSCELCPEARSFLKVIIFGTAYFDVSYRTPLLVSLIGIPHWYYAATKGFQSYFNEFTRFYGV